jgi:hypothetical protein
MNATLPLDHRILSLSSDAARWEYVVALCHAKLQEAEGVWANQAHYLAATRQSPERLAELLDAGLLAIDEGGKVYVPDWDSVQMPTDKTASVRMRRYRERIKAKRVRLEQQLAGYADRYGLTEGKPTERTGPHQPTTEPTLTSATPPAGPNHSNSTSGQQTAGDERSVRALVIEAIRQRAGREPATIEPLTAFAPQDVLRAVAAVENVTGDPEAFIAAVLRELRKGAAFAKGDAARYLKGD